MKSHLLDGAPDSFTLAPEDIHEAFERLSRTEARLLAFLCRYTFGEDKLWLHVTNEELESGLQRPDGSQRTAGTMTLASIARGTMAKLMREGLVRTFYGPEDDDAESMWVTVCTQADVDYRVYPHDFPEDMKEEEE